MKQVKYIVRASNSSTDFMSTQHGNFKTACRSAREWVLDGATKIDVVSLDVENDEISRIHYQLLVNIEHRVKTGVKRNREGEVYNGE